MRLPERGLLATVRLHRGSRAHERIRAPESFDKVVLVP
jgi:hypothetical protein